MWEVAQSTGSVDSLPPLHMHTQHTHMLKPLVLTHYTGMNSLGPTFLAISNVHQQMWPWGFAELWKFFKWEGREECLAALWSSCVCTGL